MITQQLLDYIKQQLQQHVSVESIKQALLAQGWQAQDIDDALTQLNAPPSPIPSLPIPQMQQSNMWDFYIRALKKYAVFTGRASRKEYWMFVLLNVLVSFSLIYIVALVQVGTQSTLTFVNLAVEAFLLGLACPSLAAMARRLHDTGRSGLWLLISFVPFGSLVLLIFGVQDSQPGENKYGPNPKTQVTYGKTPLWQWGVLLLIIGAAIYGSIQYFNYLKENRICCVVPTQTGQQTQTPQT